MSYDIADFGNASNVKLFLCKPYDNSIIGKMSKAYNINFSQKYGNINELSFTLPYYIDKDDQIIIDKNITNIRERYIVKLVLDEYIEYFLITKINNISNDGNFTKQVSCFSLAHELNSKIIRGYSITSKNASQVLTDTLSDTIWNIGYINAAFDIKYRTFNITSQTVLSFIFQIAETFGAVVIFDTINREINFYDIDQYGTDKGLVLSYRKYLNSIDYAVNTDEFCTRLKIYGKSNLSINEKNISGTTYLEDFSYYLYPFERDVSNNVLQHSYFMSDALCNAILDYNDLLTTKQGDFSTLLSNRASYEVTLTTKQNEMTTLQEQLAVILDNIDVAQAAGQSTSTLITQKDAKQAEISTKQNEIDTVNTNISNVDSQITTLRSSISIENNFTPTQIQERNKFVIEKEIINENIDNVDDLISWGISQFESLKYPPIVIDLSLINIYKCLEYPCEIDKKKLNMGDIVTIKHEILDINVKAKITECNFENLETDGNLNIKITNVKEILTDKEKFLKRINTAVSSSTTLSLDKFKYDDAYKNVNDVQSILNSEWDATSRNINCGVNNTVTVDERGITIKNPSDPLKFTRLVAGTIGISGDGGNSYHQCIDSNGIYAERLFGQIIAGVNLTITTGNGDFLVNETGVTIAGTSLQITNGLPDSQISSSSTWNTTATNFNNRNDRLSTTPANPTILSDGAAIDHTINTDGSADLSFEWQFSGSGDAYNIDGFIVYIHSSTSNSAYTFGTDVTTEQMYYISSEKRAFLLYGLAANLYYTFGVQSYRMVDQDINSSGILKSSIIKSTATGENPYQPSSSIAFSGNITGTINGVSAATVQTQAGNSIQQNTAYSNGFKFDPSSNGDGLTVTKSNDLVRAIMNATDSTNTAGFKIQVRPSTLEAWSSTHNKFYVDTNGKLVAVDMTAQKLVITNGSGDAVIDANTGTIDFSKFTTKLGTLLVNNVPITDMITSMNSNNTGQLNGSVITVSSITASKLNVSTLSAITANLGTVTAGSITSNTTINIGTNATIGNQLILNAYNFNSGVTWGSSGDGMFYDPISRGISLVSIGSIILSSSNGVYANNRRIDVAPTAVFG